MMVPGQLGPAPYFLVESWKLHVVAGSRARLLGMWAVLNGLWV